MTYDEVTFIRMTANNCQKAGVYCTKCRFRMLPSTTFVEGDKMYYCMPCKVAVGERSGIIMSILSLVKQEKPKYQLG